MLSSSVSLENMVSLCRRTRLQQHRLKYKISPLVKGLMQEQFFRSLWKYVPPVLPPHSANLDHRQLGPRWMEACHVTPIYNKEDLGNYGLVSLTLVLGKVMEQILLSVITWYVQDNQEIGPRQCGFMKGSSCVINLISYKQVSHLVDERHSLPRLQ